MELTVYNGVESVLQGLVTCRSVSSSDLHPRPTEQNALNTFQDAKIDFKNYQAQKN